jgi:uncharacterized protein YkwD
MKKIAVIMLVLVSGGPALAQGGVAQTISQYRQRHGLSAVRSDPVLTRLAQQQARAMAAAGVMDHSIAGSFSSRIAGANASTAAENIAAGTRDFSSTFDLWQRSPGHNANLLRPGVTRIGIASASAPNTRMKTYWALILAGSAERGPAPRGRRSKGPSGLRLLAPQ